MAKQVVVVGAGLGGLSAAIHTRLLGNDVLLLEQNDRVGGKAAGIERDGFRLDPGPSIIILTRIYADVFARAGRRMSDYLQFERLDPFTRVYFEGMDAPIDLPSGREQCLDILSNVAPEDRESLQRLMATMDRAAPYVESTIFKRSYEKPWQLVDKDLARFAMNFKLNASYKELVDEWFKSPLLRAFFYGFPSYGGQTYDAKSPAGLMIPYLMIQEGVWYPRGGVAAIPQAFANLAAELGVEIKTGVRVTGLKAEQVRIAKVETSAGSFACDAVVSNMDRFTAAELLDRKIDAPPSLSYFTLHWGLKRAVSGLKHHTLFIPRDFEGGFDDLYRKRVFPNSPIVYLNATHELDPEVAPPGCSNIFAVVTSPACEPHIDWEAEAPRYRQRVLDVLARFGTEWESDDVVFERVQTPEYFRAQHGSYRGSLYGLDEKHRLWGLFPATNLDERFSNLFYCGGAVQPGAGLPMVTLSGMFAAQRLQKRLG